MCQRFVICFHLGWSGSILQIRAKMIKVGSKSWLLTCSSNISLSLPSYNVSALQRELNFLTGILVCFTFGHGAPGIQDLELGSFEVLITYCKSYFYLHKCLNFNNFKNNLGNYLLIRLKILLHLHLFYSLDTN